MHKHRQFQEKKRFPGVICAIDDTHIQIHPPKEHGQSYVNRKNYHSIILQAICLPDMKISHVYSGWPGSALEYLRILNYGNMVRIWNQSYNW